MFLAHCH
nr:hypothetical protein 2 estrogen receptor 5'-region - chicken [Gallus gallus]CAA27432.1 unnamed protein product [Gallus gallus]